MVTQQQNSSVHDTLPAGVQSTSTTPMQQMQHTAAYNPFYDEWQACLREHLRFVIENRDTNNEKSLITVLRDTGFNDDQIAVMRTEIIAELGEHLAQSRLEAADPVTSAPEPIGVAVTDPAVLPPDLAVVVPDQPAEAVMIAYAEEAAALHTEAPEPTKVVTHLSFRSTNTRNTPMSLFDFADRNPDPSPPEPTPDSDSSVSSESTTDQADTKPIRKTDRKPDKKGTGKKPIEPTQGALF